MTKNELKELAIKLNDGKVRGHTVALHEALQVNGEEGKELSRRTVEGWLQGRQIDRYWITVVKRLAGGEVVLSRDECARIQKWFGFVPSNEFTPEDLDLVKKLVEFGS